MNSPPILEPILVGIGLCFLGRADFCTAHFPGLGVSGLNMFSHRRLKWAGKKRQAASPAEVSLLLVLGFWGFVWFPSGQNTQFPYIGLLFLGVGSLFCGLEGKLKGSPP